MKGVAFLHFEPGGRTICALRLSVYYSREGPLMAASGSENLPQTDAVEPSDEFISSAPADYEEAVAEASPVEEVCAEETTADSLAEAYGRIFQWEHNAFAASQNPTPLRSAASYLGRQSLDDRVMTLLDEVAHLMHRVRLIESEIADHRSFALEMHSQLMDVSQQVQRHDVTRRELAEAMITLQQRFRARLSSNRERSPRTPP